MLNQKTLSVLIASSLALSISSVAAAPSLTAKPIVGQPEIALAIPVSARMSPEGAGPDIAVITDDQTAPQRNVTCVSLAPYNEVEIRVTGSGLGIVGNLTPVQGYGAHFSTVPYTNGWGGRYAECHLNSGRVDNPSNHLAVHCFDGYQDPNNAQNRFFLNLRNKRVHRGHHGSDVDTLREIRFFVSCRAVKVQAHRIAINDYNTEGHPYIIESTFPIRESSGFWETGRFCYRDNSVLNDHQERQGRYYVTDVTFKEGPSCYRP